VLKINKREKSVLDSSQRILDRKHCLLLRLYLPQRITFNHSWRKVKMEWAVALKDYGLEQLASSEVLPQRILLHQSKRKGF
jgi:hypothetical protein